MHTSATSTIAIAAAIENTKITDDTSAQSPDRDDQGADEIGTLAETTAPASSAGDAASADAPCEGIGTTAAEKQTLLDRIARLEAEKAAAEEQAKLEKERADRAVAASDRKKRTHAPKTLPRPWQDSHAAKLTGTIISPGVLLTAARMVLHNLGPADFGPPPPNLDGVPQAGSKSLPRLHVRKWIADALDFAPGGIVAAAEKVERKLDELMLTAREDALRVFRVLVYRTLVAQCGGDEAKARALWPKFDTIECWDPAAVGAAPDADGELAVTETVATETTAAVVAPTTTSAPTSEGDDLPSTEVTP